MKINFKFFGILIFVFFFLDIVSFPQEETLIKVGSKKFTENVILGEIITQLITSQDQKVDYIKELGGTRI